MNRPETTTNAASDPRTANATSATQTTTNAASATQTTTNATSRAQTTMDFAVGISVFLVTVAFAFAFVPGIIAPFTDSGVGDPVTANRVADDLAADRLGTPDEPYALDAEATAAFFASDDSLTDRLALREYTSVNVTLVDAADEPVLVDGVRATAGPPAPTDADTTVAWRVVAVDGERLELVVRVW